MPKSGRQTRFERRSPFTQHLRRVQGEGPIPARLMLIGEKPGETEARVGRPFVGPAGQLLDTLLTAANLDRKDIYITNLVKEFTDYTKPTSEEIERDWPELMEEIEQVNPEIIGLLGTFAVEAVLHRERAEMERTHGCPERNGDNRVFVPCYHPAAGLYNADVMANVLDDFLRLGQLVDGEITVRTDEYLGQEKYETWSGAFYVQTDCAIDTEGTRSHPWCLTWSQKPGTAYLVRRVPPNSGFGGHVYLHNSLHDLGVLREMGIELGERQFTDTMVLAYHLCIEPQGLKALAYRHCGAHQDEYQDVIGNVGADKALEYLLAVSAQEWPAPEPYVVLDKGVPKMKKPQGVNRLIDRAIADLAADKRDKQGNPVDLRKRWHSWDDTVKVCVIEQMGEMPDATLDDVDPEVAQRYACRDADITLRIAPILEQRVKDMGLTEAVRVDHAVIPMIDRMQQVGIQLAPVEFWNEIEQQCETQMGKARYEIYKMTGAEINPASGDQVAELLYGQLGLTPPRMTDSGTRGSTKDEYLEALLPEAPVVEHVMDYREADKIRGTYVVPLRRIASAVDSQTVGAGSVETSVVQAADDIERDSHASMGQGRVRCNFRITRVSSGRLAASDPNLLAIPIRSELGATIRAGFIAPDGRILGDWDLNQIEMRLMAHESRDENLCRAYLEGHDIHVETAARAFGCKESQVEPYQRQAGKVVGFGIINGISEKGLVVQMIKYRARRPNGDAWTEDDCLQMLGAWFSLRPGVKRFQQDCVREAQETGLARESISGRIRYLPAVWSTIPYLRGEAERQSYSHRIQSGAQAIIKRAMAVVWNELCKDPDLGVEPLLQVHDELLLEMPDRPEIKEYVDAAMCHIMSTTTQLRIPVKASGGFGHSWKEAH